MFADFAHRAEPGIPLGDTVGGLEGGGHGTGDTHADAGPGERGGVDVVVTHVGALRGGEAEGGGEFMEGGELVGAALDEVRDLQLGGAGARR